MQKTGFSIEKKALTSPEDRFDQPIFTVPNFNTKWA